MVYAGPQPMKKRRGFFKPLVILLILAAIGYAIFHFFFTKPPAPPAPPPPLVTAQQVQTADIPLTFEYSARLTGSREDEIRARVDGILLKRAYTEGQYVHRGDLLVVIDPAPYQAALAEAQATFEQAERDHKRAVILMKQKALSAREFDEAEATYQAAKARVDAARINLDFCTVRAPISGYTSEETHSEGTLVQANTTLLTTLTQLDPIYVEFAYPDSEAMLQRQGLANGSMRLPKDKMLHVEVVMGDGTKLPHEAAIRFTDSIVDTNTGTVRARAVLDNHDQTVMPGQFVRVRVKGITAVNAIGIPEQAIMQGPQGTFVYVVNGENKAAVTPVELGLLNDGTRLITKGLKDGDKVITEGMIKVKPDTAVKIDEPAPAGDPAATPTPTKG